jgi:D-hydroxyproline dehydrogenase subunit gamma
LIRITINGVPTTVTEGTTVAAAILNLGEAAFRVAIGGESRGPLCGMGICFECRVNINGDQHVPSCMLFAEDGMEIVTGE